MARARSATAAPPRINVDLKMFFSLGAAPGVSRWDAGGRPIPGATVRIRGTGISAVTNASGRATLPLGAPQTGRVLEIEPAAGQLSPGPSGPGHGSGGFASAPTLLLRPFQVTVDVDARGFVTATAPVVSMTAVQGAPPHALAFSLTQTALTLDWKPDWLKSGNRAAATPKNNDFLVLHQTGVIERVGNHLNTFTNPSNVTGIHYLVDVDGHVIKLVHESDRVNHTGPAFWVGRTDLNRASVGIEIVHLDNPVHDFPDPQLQSVSRLVREIRAAHPTITRSRVVGHSDVATASATNRTLSSRRIADPGEAFAWDRLESANLVRHRVVGPPGTDYNIPVGHTLRPGQTHASGPAGRSRVAADISRLQRDLSAIGYSIAPSGAAVSGVFDAELEAAVRAFQQRYFSGGNRLLRNAAFRLGIIDSETATAISLVHSDPA